MGAGFAEQETVGLELWKKELSGGIWSFKCDEVTAGVASQLRERKAKPGVLPTTV